MLHFGFKSGHFVFVEAALFDVCDVIFFRQNMKELDTLQQNLNLKLRPRNVWDDASHTQEELSVVEPTRHFFLDTGVTVEASVETLKTLKTKLTPVVGLGMDSKPPRTGFVETDVRHEILSISVEPSGVPEDDGHLFASHVTPLETDYTNEKTGDAILAGGPEASNSKDIFPFSDGKEHLQHDAKVDSFFGLEKNRSVLENRRPSVDSELSDISDISGECSVSGYVQDNTKATRFTNIKDSWLSSEEDDTTPDVDEVEEPVGLSTPPSVFNKDSETVSKLRNAAESKFLDQEGDVDSDDDVGYVGDCAGNSEEHYPATGSHVGKEDLIKSSIENCNGRAGLTTERTSGFVNSPVDEKAKVFEDGKENEHSPCTSYDSLQSRELPRQPSLSSYHPTSVNLPNFFMPSEQLAESMRALRLGLSHHNTSSSQSKLLARSNHLQSVQQTRGKLTERFVEREPVYKARRNKKPPISMSEADRIARIFNSGSV